MVDIYSTVTRFFQDGGFFIYPIGFILAIGLVIAFERWVYLTRERRRNIKAFEDFLPLLRTTDLEKMQLYTREVSVPVTRIIGCGIDMMKVSKQRADIENSMSEGMLETMPRIEERTNYLAVLANVATLLGLLGTIIGLIGAFTAVANADPAEKSELLSLSISVAMNTTAFGLISAIPLLILHTMLQNKTAKIVTSIEMAAVKFLNIMTIHRLIEAGLPRQSTASSPFSQAAQAAPVAQAPQMAQPAVAPAQMEAAVAPAPAVEVAPVEAAPVEVAQAESPVPEETSTKVEGDAQVGGIGSDGTAPAAS